MAIWDRFRTPPPPEKTPKPKGRSGTVNTSGYLHDTRETNLLWQWPESLQIIEEMRRTDPSVKWSLSLIKTPIRAATWVVEPTDDSDEAREIAAFVSYCLFERLDGGFDDFLRRALSYLDYGHSVFEEVASFEQCAFAYEDEEGNRQEVEREAFVIARLAERLQSTIQKWNPNPKDSSQLASIEQWLGDGTDPATVEIPADRLLLFTHDQEGDDWRGTSLLRAAWKSYDYKLKLENLEAIAYERSIGIPVVYPADNAEDGQLDSVEDGLKRLRQGESVFIIMPGPKRYAESGSNGWDFDVKSISGDGSRSANEAITRHEAALARNVLAEFMRLGHEETGARATADVQQDPYYQAVEAQVRYVEDVVSEQVVAALVRWNYGDAKPPRLKASKITGKNVQVLAGAAASLIGAKAITMDLDVENALRELLDLPKRKPGDDEADPYADPEDPEPPDPEAMSERGGNPFVPWRDLRPEEEAVALSEISRRLDSARDAMAAVVENAARPAVERAQELARGATSPEEIAAISVETDQIEQAVARELERLYDYGRAQVQAELRKQGSTTRFDAADALAHRGEAFRRLVALAVTAAQSLAQAATRAIRNYRLREIEAPAAPPPTGPGYEPFASLRAEAGQVALGLTTTAFGAGRKEELLARSAEITTYIRSAILDANTCAACAEGEGIEIGDPEDPRLTTPNPECEGGAACRCLVVPVIREFD